MISKLLMIAVFAVANFVSTTRVSIDSRNFGNNSLESIAKEWDGNKDFDKAYYKNLVEPCDNPEGSPDYVDYSSQNYYQQTTFNRKTYFQNLYAYSANNSVGSCGFVSLIQAMSYYDSFYNDNIIPETYDKFDSNQTSEASVKLVSPGVLNQAYSSSYGTYYQFCHDTMADNFQSKLTVLKNQLNGTDNNGTHLDGDGNTVNNFTTSIGGWDYQSLLNSLYSGSGVSVSVTEYANKSNSEFVSIIKSIINNGDPAVVHIKKFDSLGVQIGYHSVVAYEYDESGIYANFGWGSGSTHYQLLGGTAGYTLITQVYSLDYSSNEHVHSNNYVISSKGHCGCNLSDEILFRVEPDFKNIPPTLYWMKDVYDSDESFDLYIRNGYSSTNIVSLHTSNNKLTLSRNQWSLIINNTTSSISFILKRYKTDTNYAQVRTLKAKPTINAQHFTISPSEYGFTDAYPYSQVQQSVTQGSISFNTKRLRCGYIHDEFINLSPRRLGAGLAYLEFEFSINIYAIDLDISMWSNSEMTSAANSTAYIQYKDLSGNYHNLIDLYNDITLSKDRTNQDHLVFTFPELTTSFRFYTTSDAVGDRNKGRISIGDLSVYYA